MNINLPPKRNYKENKKHELYAHLENPKDAIVACIDDIKNEDKIKKLFEESDALFIDYDTGEEEMNQKGIAHDGQFSFFISPIDERKKYSREYNVCYGAIINGIDNSTSKNISIMIHLPPDNINNYKFKFILGKKINEFRKRCKKNTIDAVIFGGAEYIIDDKELEDVTEQKYGDEIKTVSNIFQKLLKFTPTIISGQNRIKSEIGDNDFNKHYQHFYFDTENRRLYIFKPNIDSI